MVAKAELMPLSPQKKILSVVMPVHNAMPHLDKAVESILHQTYPEFDFIIYDDDSSDGSTERLRYWSHKDSRIHLLEGERRLGPVGSSNWVVAQADKPIVARMDADDISHPERFQRQLELLLSRPDLGLIGTLAHTIDADGHKLRRPDLWRLHRKSWFAPFPHGSIMYRREIFDRVGGYRDACVFWEDQDLFLRISSFTKIVTIPYPLYEYRHSETSTRLGCDREHVEDAVDLMYRSVGRLEENRGYEDLLGERQPSNATGIDPRVFISLGSIVLWAGGQPRLLRRLLSRAKLRPNFASVAALTWAIWAALSPASLRAFMRLVAALRNALLWPASTHDGPIDWVTPRKLPPADGRQRTRASGDVDARSELAS